MSTSNDTREALAAECKTLAESYADGPHDGGYYGARRTALYAAIDRLAALTEQPAAQAEPSNRDTLLCDRACVVTGRCTGSCRANSVSALPQPSTSAPQGVQAEPPRDELWQIALDYAVACGELSKGLPEDDPMWADLLALGKRLHAVNLAAPAQEPQRLERRMPDGLIDSLIASETPGFGLPSPAPAVQPTEAVAELVEALALMYEAAPAASDLRKFGWTDEEIEEARVANGKAVALIAKHGQPQGSQ